MDKAQQKTWKDRVPPDGHLPASYEVQVCDEGNKVIAVQMLDKSGIDYKISARKGQFYIQAADMQTFTKIKGVLNQSLDMNKEADKMGFKPEMPTDITPVSTNTPQADITASNVAVTEPVKEDIVSEVKVNDTVKLLDYVQKNGKKGINTYARVTKVNSDGSIEVTNMNMPFQGTLAHAKIAKDKFLKEGSLENQTAIQTEMEKAFKKAGCDQHQWEVWVMAWTAAAKFYGSGIDSVKESVNESYPSEKTIAFEIKNIKKLMKQHYPEWSNSVIEDFEQYLEDAFVAGYEASNTGQSRDKLLDKAIENGEEKILRQFPKWSKMVDDMGQYLEHAFNAGYDWS